MDYVEVMNGEFGMATDLDSLLALSELTQKDKIQILLAEYGALRGEILARTGFGFQIAAVSLGAITWFLAQQLSGRPWWFWCAMGIVGTCFAIAMFVNSRDGEKTARRLKDIEYEVNSRAGEHILVWETLNGAITRMGLIRSYFSLIPPLPRSELPPLDPKYLEQQEAIKKKTNLPGNSN
jgi:hypothetical protein